MMDHDVGWMMLESWMDNVGCWMDDVGCWMDDVGCWMDDAIWMILEG